MDNHSVWVLKRIGGNTTTPYLLKVGLNSVGRSLDDNNIVCQSIWVSRHHCDIDVRKGVVFIKDRGSFNGTFIENFRLDSDRYVELKNGDFISLGKAYTRGQALDNDHYVYKILACMIPQKKSHDESRYPLINRRPSISPIHERENRISRTSSSSQNPPIKRRSSISPIRESVKRFRRTSPSVTSTTSPKVSAADDAIVVDIVDLTDDEPMIKKENYLDNQRKREIRTDIFQKQESIPPLNQNGNTNTTSKWRPSESLISDIEPIASSTLMNSALEKNLDDRRRNFCPAVKNGGDKNKVENKNMIKKDQNFSVYEQPLPQELENNGGFIGNISRMEEALGTRLKVDNLKTIVQDKETSSIGKQSPPGIVVSATSSEIDSISSGRSTKIQTCSDKVESEGRNSTERRTHLEKISQKSAVDDSHVIEVSKDLVSCNKYECSNKNQTLSDKIKSGESNSTECNTSVQINSQKSPIDNSLDKWISKDLVSCSKYEHNNIIQTSPEKIEPHIPQLTSGNSTILNKEKKRINSSETDCNEGPFQPANDISSPTGKQMLKNGKDTLKKKNIKSETDNLSDITYKEGELSCKEDSILVTSVASKKAEMPQASEMRKVREMPQARVMPKAREMSQTTEIPEASEMRQVREMPQVRVMLQAIVMPQVREVSQTRGMSQTREMSQAREMPQAEEILPSRENPQVREIPLAREMPQTREMSSPCKSPNGFLGFGNEKEPIAKRDSIHDSHVSSSQDHVISNHLLKRSCKQHSNRKIELKQIETNTLNSNQEKNGANETVIHSINSVSEKQKNTSVNSCRRTKRSNSSFDAQDVEKLLHDLKNTEEMDNFDKYGKTTSTIPKKPAQIPIENQKQKRPRVSARKRNKKSSNDIYKKIEQELRDVVGESIGDDSYQLSGTSLPEVKLKNIPVEDPVIEIIDLVDNDDQNSFSQSGLNTVIEMDENDEEYSQIFPNPEQRNKFEDLVHDVKPFAVGRRIIKEEVDELQEDDELELFESHFSQCSQEIAEEIEEENRNEIEEKAVEETLQKNNVENRDQKNDVENEDQKKNIENRDQKNDVENRDQKNDFENRDVTDSCGNVENMSDKAISSEICVQGPNLVESKANDTITCSAKKVNTEGVPPEPKNPCSALPSSVEEVSNERKSVSPVTVIPESEELTGVKLIKSTLLSKPPEKKKKDGRSRSKEEPSATKQAMLKRHQDRIKSERSAKLKNLALQNKTSESGPGEKNNSKLINNKENEKDCSSKHDPVENTVGTLKVAKITERNRGTILLEGFLESKSVPRKRGRPRKNAVIQDSLEIIERKDEPKKDRQKSCIKSLNIVSPIKKVMFNPNPMIRSYECEGTLTRKVNNSVSKDKAPLQCVRQYQEISNNEFLMDVLHWNASWRKESKVVKGDPPVYHDVFNTKDVFVSYTDYKRWLYPLLLYEVWASMMKRMDEMENLNCTRTFTGVILSKESKPNSREKLLTLHCCAPLLSRNDISTFLDPSDILMFFVNTTGKKGLMMYGIVGSHIKFCSARETPNTFARVYLSKLNYRPEFCAYFDVYIYNSPTRLVEVGNNIKIQPTYNISTELKQYEGLIKLKSSPLLDTILDPEKNCTVFLSKDLNDKLISTYPLNDEQTDAILRTSQTVFSNKPSINLILGPPGTGKTRVIVGIAEQILYRFKSKNGKKQRILICAQTNAAVDEICQRLLELRHRLPREKRFRLSRFGRQERIHPKLVDILTYSIAKTEVNKMNLDEAFSLELSLLKAQERMVANALESPKEPERSNYKKKYELIQGSIRELERLVNKTASEEARRKQIEKMIRDEELKVIYHSDIVATTLASCASKRLLKAFNLNDSSLSERGEVGVCIVDEASQATDLATLLPLVHDVKNFIFVGDPQQLSPMVNSETSKKNGLSRSLFSRLYKVWSGVNLESKSSRDHLSIPVYKLKLQYRMHPEIAQFPSMAFYKNELESPSFLTVDRGFKPYALFTHKHLSDPDCAETNQKEAELVVDFVVGILEQPVFNCLSIGLIVPYQKQRAIISDLLHDKKLMRLITVNTIDSYQGQEKDIIILTCVRTNGLGFLSDYQRTNVAITRAKRGLYIIGNFASLQADPVWKNLFTNAQSRALHLDLKSSCKGNEIIDFVVDRRRKRSR